MKRVLLLIALLAVPAAALAQVKMPQPIRQQDLGRAPFRWNGQVVARAGEDGLFTGSGVILHPHVYATAAHVIFEEEKDSWIPANRVRFNPGQHSTEVDPDNGLPTAGFVVWESYVARSVMDDTPEGSSNTETFNADFVAGYTLNPILADGSFAPAFVDDPDTVSFLRQKRTILVTGYPTQRDLVPASNRGLLHATEFYPFNVEWYAPQLEESAHYDSYNFWWSLYDLFDLTVGQGNSGGPVWAQDDANRWLVNGLVVGGADTFSLVRGLDLAAWRLVEEAQSVVDASRWLPRITHVMADASDRTVTLRWEHTFDSAAVRYEIQRRGAQGYEAIQTLEVSELGDYPEFSYRDLTVQSGTEYSYRVVPINATGSRSPASPLVRIQTRGSQPEIGQGFSSPGLHFRTGGDAPAFHPWGEAARSGLVYSMESSYIELNLIGPGVLKFEWSVSSEENDRYGVPNSPLSDAIYDAFYFYLNGEEEDWISGELGPRVKAVPLGIGPHVLRWEYRKDPYADEGEDAGFLHNVEWAPNNSQLYFFGASAVDATYRYAHWFGYYTYADLPWTHAWNHGWLYLAKAGSHDLWAFDPDPELGWLYLSPHYFPYLYNPEKGWLYYYPGTGQGGEGRWFHLVSENRDFQT